MNNLDMNIAVAVGYFLKIRKNCIDTSVLGEEFKAIRHGRYLDFIELTEEPTTPDVVAFVLGKGVVKLNTIEDYRDKAPLAKLFAAGSAIIEFYKKCKKEFGEVECNDFSDATYRKLAMFEIGLRMHYENKSQACKESLYEVIEAFVRLPHKDRVAFTKKEVKLLHEGRVFLNAVKHADEKKNDNWKSKVNAFEDAYALLEKKKIMVF